MLTLPQIADKIHKLERQGVSSVIEIGGLLKQAKDKLEHGEYADWVDKEFAWGYRTAVRYRAAYDFAQKCHSVRFGHHGIRALRARRKSTTTTRSTPRRGTASSRRVSG